MKISRHTTSVCVLNCLPLSKFITLSQLDVPCFLPECTTLYLTVTSPNCYIGTLLHWYTVTLLHWYTVTLHTVTLLHCTLLYCYNVTLPHLTMPASLRPERSHDRVSVYRSSFTVTFRTVSSGPFCSETWVESRLTRAYLIYCLVV